MSDPSADARDNANDPMIGRVLADRYEIEGRLGKGGMAVVYKAIDRNFGRTVAIKVLRTDVAKDPVAAKRLTREARAAGQLHHPHIITMHDVGAEDGLVYIVMEVLVGCELSDLMEEVGAIEVGRSLEIARQVASALAVAHRAGIIHRDIKPENLFLIETESSADYVKMLDFSIAKLPSAMVTAALTRAGSVFGTPHYMAPEQVEGRTVCPQTDLYALGAVLYECVAGEPPFDGDSVIDILLQHARAKPPKLADLGIWLPDGLSELVDSLLAKKEADRPESAAVVEHALEQMIEATRSREAVVPPTVVRDRVTNADIAEFMAGAEAPPSSGPPSAGPPPDGPPPSGPPPGAAPAAPLSMPDASPPPAWPGAPDATSSSAPSLPAASDAPPLDLPGAPLEPDDLPGAPSSAVHAATLMGAGLAHQVRDALAAREAARAEAGAALADIAPPPEAPAPVPEPAAKPVSAPSSIVIKNVPPPPESRARVRSKLRKEARPKRTDRRPSGKSSRAASAAPGDAAGGAPTRRDLVAPDSGEAGSAHGAPKTRPMAASRRRASNRHDTFIVDPARPLPTPKPITADAGGEASAGKGGARIVILAAAALAAVLGLGVVGWLVFR